MNDYEDEDNNRNSDAAQAEGNTGNDREEEDLKFDREAAPIVADD